MFKLSRQVKILLLVFLLAFFLRTYRLSTFPFGFHADEVRVGWNAYSILKTGKDDRGNKFALYYNTFGDFRPTGIFYLTIPSIAVFGTNEFAVRFPSALFGALTVIPLYLFVKELAKKKKSNINHWPLAVTAGALLAVSPWHISVSRATSEVVVALFLALFGLYFFLRLLNEQKLKHALASIALVATSYFFYHTVRVLAPIFIAAIILYSWKIISKTKIKKVILGVLGVLFIITLLFIQNKEARGRFSQVSIFSDLDVQYELSRMPFEEGPNKVFIARLFHNKPSVYARHFINEYAKYFSSNFFLEDTTPKPTRYQTVGVGLLTYVGALLFVLGLVTIAQRKNSALPLLLLLLAPIPAAMTTEDAPNLHRALFMLPFISIIAAYGIGFLHSLTKKGKSVVIFAFLLLTFNLIFFLHMYFVHNKIHLPLYRNVGAKELALLLNEVQDNYDKIILTNIPDDPYPWIAFFTGRDPRIFNQDAIAREQGVWTHENFVFTGQRCPSRDAFEKPEVKRLLVVDAEGCATESNLKDREDVEILRRVLRPDESEVYIFWSRIEE
ncbi:glycosyltransferase family 39 protein [Patescibacteria group bacterium]|nr:glycosyltransferase family 39 protein [Patescibacteria group bacterium]